jgi:hypothetical protein
MTAASDQSGRRDNGLTAEHYVPLIDVDAAMTDVLLTALRRARIAAYLETPSHGAVSPYRLFVAEDERADAATIVAAAARHAQSAIASDGDPARPPTGPDDSSPIASAGADPDADTDGAPSPGEPVDTDETFREMVANWHVDTVAAVRAAERDLSREDAEWRARLQPPEPASEEEHYVPPPPPPLPKLAIQTIWALIILIASVAMLAFGDLLGLGGNVAFFIGVGGILIGTGMLLMRLRESPSDDGGDDGAVI